MKKLFLAIACSFISVSIQAQWVSQISNISPSHFAPFIDAVDQNVCWALVADPANQTAPIQEFTRTIDGGQTWIDDVISNATGLCPSSICALNADTAWVAMFDPAGTQGKILRTNDGGVTWTHQSTALFNTAGNFPDFIYFWDAHHGLCLGDPTSSYFEIYTTSDGGTNWARVPFGSLPPLLASEWGITDVFTADKDSTLWFGTNKGRIYKTSDRGTTWTVAQTPFTDFIGAIAFRDSLHGLATSGGNIGSMDVARTNDGGTTWTLVGTNTAGMSLKLSMCYVPGTDSTYFISTSAAGSVDGTTYSPNDGTNWIPVDNLIHTDIDFVNDSTGWTGSNQTGAPMYKWSTPVRVPLNEVASLSIDASLNTGNFVQLPKATFRNNGINQQNFDVTMTITGGYSSTKTISNLALLSTTQVTFDPWTPAIPGLYTMMIYTSLGSDSDHSNDTLRKTIHVFEGFDNCGWVSKPDISDGRYGLAGTFYLDGLTSSSPGTLFSLGGADLTALQTTVNAFTTATNSWNIITDLPTVKYQFSAQRVGSQIICSGGYSGGFVPDSNTYIYDIPSGSWTIGTAMPVPVGDYASGVYNDSLVYYIGGRDALNDQTLVQIYNPTNDDWTSGTPTIGSPCAGLRGSINDNKIVIAGGYSSALGGPIDESYLGSIDPLNPGTIAWTSIGPYPAGTMSRLGAGSVYQNFRKLIIFTGGDPTGTGTTVSGSCWGYDLLTNQWLIGPEKISPVNNISDFAGILSNDTLWMAAVSGYTGSTLSTSNEWLCLGQQLWSGLGNTIAVQSKSVMMYPNPVKGELTILPDTPEQVSSLEIIDALGRSIINKLVSGPTVEINTLAFAPGVYTVRMMNSHSISFGKFIKD